ncbi:PilZ domain-containing protein [Thermodesulforhabdus norvegica]|uniref:PilZ domain-containing protein n=1 Tax=Thermodesulforhabdus norvegica TaxID=39841 RepID=A0A1I4SN16_9BACT|nr:PilZ domain-containing protein [Thermodesulforhabdus norvegica]SFM65797.1 PilZ domain-containing protein [Thermodesulforhabdus norvegica]
MAQPKPVQVLMYIGDDIFVGTSNNFGPEGILIQMSDPPMLGTPVKLKLQFPDLPNAIEAAGEVVWTNPYGTGDAYVPKGCAVKFKGLPSDVASALNNLSFQYHQSGDPLKFYYS